jgi:hypothetical protein
VVPVVDIASVLVGRLDIKRVVATRNWWEARMPTLSLKDKDGNLDHPVLSGWSYGPLVFLDYIRH